MPIDNLKDMFFAECEELLEQLSEGLEAMEAGEADAETVNAVFRAVHSIKGTAGAFGFAHLVGFTHHFETVLDLIRSEQLTAELDTMRLMLRSSDVLSDLVEYARSRPDEQPANM
ncbi:MAG: Hpt domain-containing protein, partial [Pseudomonadota bacterium]